MKNCHVHSLECSFLTEKLFNVHPQIHSETLQMSSYIYLNLFLGYTHLFSLTAVQITRRYSLQQLDRIQIRCVFQVLKITSKTKDDYIPLKTTAFSLALSLEEDK